MSLLGRRPSKEADEPNEPQRLPLRWALIGLASIGIGIGAGLTADPSTGVLAGAGLAVALHKILG
jgi:hypothetical protein